MNVVRLTFLLLLFIAQVEVASAQLVNEKFCEEVVDLIAAPLGPVHWYRNIVFNNQCDFEFDIDTKGGIGVMFDLERFEKVSEARREFASFMRLFDSATFRMKDDEWIVDKDRRRPLSNEFWDDSSFYTGKDGPLVLRKKRTLITIFCDQPMLCMKFERLLRQNPQYVGF